MLTAVLPVCLASDAAKVCYQGLFSLASLVNVIDRQNPPSAWICRAGLGVQRLCKPEAVLILPAWAVSGAGKHIAFGAYCALRHSSTIRPSCLKYERCRVPALGRTGSRVDAEGRLAILLMFSVKLVQEIHVAGELIPDQHAVPGLSQPSRESVGWSVLHTQTQAVMIGSILTMKPKVKKQRCLSLAHTYIPST